VFYSFKKKNYGAFFNINCNIVIKQISINIKSYRNLFTLLKKNIKRGILPKKKSKKLKRDTFLSI